MMDNNILDNLFNYEPAKIDYPLWQGGGHLDF